MRSLSALNFGKIKIRSLDRKRNIDEHHSFSKISFVELDARLDIGGV